MDDVRAFWREHNFDLRTACVRKEYDSEDDSETLQPAKTTRREFRNRFGGHRNRSLSPHSKRSRYDSPDRRSESRERSGSRGYSRSRDYENPRETRTDADKMYNGFETRNESRGRGRGTYRGRGYSYQGRGQSYQDRDQSNQERYREAQKYNPYTKQAFNKTKNPINWNRTHQFEDKNRGEGWDDNPNDDWTKRTQMQKTHQIIIVTESQPGQKMKSHNTRYQHRSPNSLPIKLKEYNRYKYSLNSKPQLRYRSRKGELVNHRIRMTSANRKLSKKDSPHYRKKKNNWAYLTQILSGNNQLELQIVTITQHPDKDQREQREIQELKAKQQLQQQKNIDLNDANVEIPDIQGTVGQLTGSQPSPIAESPGINAGLRQMEAGSISASIRERTEPQINEGHDDNADEEEDEQTDEAALNQNKGYRVNMNSQPPVQENLGTQPENNQGLNALSQMEKDNTGPAPVRVQEKPKWGRGSKKSNAEGLNAFEVNQGNNAQAQTTSKAPKTKAASKRGKKAVEEDKPEPKNSNNEGEEEHSP
ncbi:MAG: hypothetical protein EZS28_002618 [Streblomastix strix]|uniref:Uncharacterized protein n=1 Tax=Streblomastix strix TaxID=222440 RepID=A0A5J4X3G1_9EUKA|nr:MAG: hypothetical protein EZS28_002618 [Streblomastix strix]